MTQEDYIYYLKRKITRNKEKILEINKKNQEIQKMIENVQTKKNQKSLKKLYIK